MSYDEFIITLINSKREDWIYDDDLERYVYKGNISISIISDKDNKNKEYYEDWTNNFADRTAYRARFFLCFNNSTVEAFYTAAVDGYRALIPYPNTKTMTITQKQYKIAALINISYSRLDEYLLKAGITVNDNQPYI